MSYRKFRADKLFTGTEVLSNDHVLITNETGKVEDIIPVQDAGDSIETFTGWLTPGFVNCHCHLELSHMKGLVPTKTGLVNFVSSIVEQRHFPDEEILQSIADAEAEMIRNGIVAVGDICNNQLTLSQKMLDNLHYYSFVEASGWTPGIASMRFLRSEANLFSFEPYHPSTIVPHAPYSVSNELFKLIAPCLQGKVVSIHNQEAIQENDLFQSNTGDFLQMYQKMNIDHSHFKPTGKTSLQSYFKHIEDAANIILVHNTFTSVEDIEFIQQSYKFSDTFLCICINANQYIEGAVPPIDLFRKYKANIVLGTDSLASNWSLSIWDEIKTIKQHFSNIPLEEMLQWATLNGAKALQMDDKLGSFHKGKMPGIVLIDGLQVVKRII